MRSKLGCTCKKKVAFRFEVSFLQGSAGRVAAWAVQLCGRCTRCGRDEGLETRYVQARGVLRDGTEHSAVEVDVQLAMVAMLPKGVTMAEVEVRS